MSITSTLVPLRWSDMDAYGHINNVQYLRLLEDARIDAFEAWFGDRGSLLGRVGVVVARQEIEYLHQMSFRRAPVRIAVWVSRIGGASFDLAYEIGDDAGAGDEAYARAETTLATVDLAAGQVRAIPKEDRAVLTAHLAEPPPMRRRR